MSHSNYWLILYVTDDVLLKDVPNSQQGYGNDWANEALLSKIYFIPLYPIKIQFSPHLFQNIYIYIHTFFFERSHYAKHHLGIWEGSVNRRDEDLSPHAAHIPAGEDRPFTTTNIGILTIVSGEQLYRKTQPEQVKGVGTWGGAGLEQKVVEKLTKKLWVEKFLC